MTGLSADRMVKALGVSPRKLLAYITNLINQRGVPAEQAERKALLLYFSSVGYFATSDIIGDELKAAVLEDLLELATGMGPD